MVVLNLLKKLNYLVKRLEKNNKILVILFLLQGAVELVRMAICADFRGQGVSSLLVLAVARFGLSLNCDWVVLTTGMA